MQGAHRQLTKIPAVATSLAAACSFVQAALVPSYAASDDAIADAILQAMEVGCIESRIDIEEARARLKRTFGQLSHELRGSIGFFGGGRYHDIRFVSGGRSGFIECHISDFVGAPLVVLARLEIRFAGRITAIPAVDPACPDDEHKASRSYELRAGKDRFFVEACAGRYGTFDSIDLKVKHLPATN